MPAKPNSEKRSTEDKKVRNGTCTNKYPCKTKVFLEFSCKMHDAQGTDGRMGRFKYAGSFSSILICFIDDFSTAHSIWMKEVRLHLRQARINTRPGFDLISFQGFRVAFDGMNAIANVNIDIKKKIERTEK